MAEGQVDWWSHLGLEQMQQDPKRWLRPHLGLMFWASTSSRGNNQNSPQNGNNVLTSCSHREDEMRDA